MPQRNVGESAIAPRSAPVTSISRDEMIELPIGRYEGPVYVVEGQADLRLAMRDIFDDVAIGFVTHSSCSICRSIGNALQVCRRAQNG